MELKIQPQPEGGVFVRIEGVVPKEFVREVEGRPDGVFVVLETVVAPELVRALAAQAQSIAAGLPEGPARDMFLQASQSMLAAASN